LRLAIGRDGWYRYIGSGSGTNGRSGSGSDGRKQGRLITETCDKHGVEPTVLAGLSPRGIPVTIATERC
jgi:hypothetical protein